jgi:pimeloyl-ACP methyl ester carboxylesterase
LAKAARHRARAEFRAASSPGTIKAVLEALRDTDVRALLPRIRTPTLVLHRRGDRAVRIEAGRHLSDAIPGSRFVALDGKDHWLWAGEQSAALEQIRNFLSHLPTAIGSSPRQ